MACPRAEVEQYEDQTRKGKYRFVVLTIVCLHLSMVLVSLITFNSAFVSIQDITTSPLYEDANRTSAPPNWASNKLNLSDRRFVLTPIMKALSFAGAFGATVVCVQPMALFIRKFGVHRSVTYIGLLGAAAVAFTPFAISISFPLFLFIRVINGLTFSMPFTVAGIVCHDWAPLEERGIFIAALTGHVEVAAMYAMPLGGAVASALGWPYIFFLNGAILFITTVLFATLYRDKPLFHPYVRQWEIEKISRGKTKQQEAGSNSKPPYRAIFASPVIWASWVAVIGIFFVSQFTITWSPVYLNKVLHYSPVTTGIISVIPLFCQLLIKVFSGLMSDKLKCADDVTKLRIFNSIALVGGAVFFAIVSVVTPTPNWIDTFLSLAPVALLGFHAGGYPKCLVMVSRQHSAFVMSVVQMVSCGTMFVGSFVVPLMAPNNTFDEWSKVFILYAIMLVVTNTIFLIFAKSTPASWTEENSKNTNRISAVHENIPRGQESVGHTKSDVEHHSDASSNAKPTL